VARAQAPDGGSLAVPLDGVRVEALHLTRPLDEAGRLEACLYVALEGEVVVDLPVGAFVHLRPGESATVEAGTARRLSPVGSAVVLRVSRGPD
jgi:hypothetical protein